MISGLRSLFKKTDFVDPLETMFPKDEMTVKKRREEERQRPHPQYQSSIIIKPKPEIPLDQTIVSMLLKLYERYAKKLYDPTSTYTLSDHHLITSSLSYLELKPLSITIKYRKLNKKKLGTIQS